MQVYISVDMEGVAGVVHGDQTRRGTGEFATACELMTLEANAAATGAFAGGATGVVVNDAHGDMRNLVLDRLDPRVEVITGALKPFSMAEGLLGRHHDLALFIGYHAGAGTAAAILDHTYRGNVVAELRVNGRPFNEAALNAMIAGAAGTPVALVSGDATTCTQCRALLGDIETVAVKSAIGRLAAQTIHPMVARDRIEAAATKCVREASRFRPFVVAAPYELEIDVVNTAIADAAAIAPGVERSADRTLRWRVADVQTLFRAMLTTVRLGGTVA